MLSTCAPERAEDRRALAHRPLDLGVDVVEEERLGEGEPEPADAVLEPGERVVRLDAVGRLVAGVLALQRLVDEGGVRHRPGQGPDRVQGEAERVDARAAHASDGRLEADGAAEGGRQPDRAPGVAPERHRDQPGPDGHRRAAGRAARDVMRRVPRVVRGALVVVRADSAEGELDRVGLADEDHAGAGQAPDDGRVLFRHVPGEEPGACGRRHAPDVEEVLGGVRDAMERPEVLAPPERELGGARLGERPLPGHRDERVEAAVERRDPLEQRLGQRDRAERPGADLRSEPGDGFERQGGVGHA